LRAVLDPNVIISGVLSSKGSPARVLEAWREGRFEVVVSPQLLAELRRALAYPKLRMRITEVRARELVTWISQVGVSVDDPERHLSIRSSDSGDDYLIALAAAHKAALVSGDNHILELISTIPVYPSADFLRLIEAET
jgi:putative PIN family toxin of toxin-antitoxin system